jgi:hypothetical protein
MRKMIAAGFMWTGFVAGFAATAAYVYWMWLQDWGPMGTRGHNLMLVLMLFGAVAVFLVALFVFGMIAVTIDKDLGK